jgi:NAD(P)-dependent dehydrogenase (short-subunit alcohol dehydrogenase family)
MLPAVERGNEAPFQCETEWTTGANQRSWVPQLALLPVSEGSPPSNGEKRVAIVTGGSQGIGAGVVDAFRDAGYAVVATALSIPLAEERDFLSVAGDIAEPETAERVVGRTLERFGRIDTLVNNAGVYIEKAFTDYTVDDYAVLTGVNLAGFFHITQRVIPQMVAQGRGHIVNISTSLVDEADSTRPAALTSLTKGGLVAAARSLAIEYASRGVRVNALSLGVIRTPVHDPASYAGMASLHPLGRLGEVGDVVDGILYLERATFVTGEVLHIDGGQAAGH